MNSECSQQNRANENKHGAYRQRIEHQGTVIGLDVISRHLQCERACPLYPKSGHVPDLPRDHARQAPFKEGLFHRGVHQGVPRNITTLKRGLDAARKSPVPVRSVDFIRPDGSRVSFIMDNATKTDTDPVTTITESELKELI